jgi:release factor glutamine methyltransferase
MFVQHNDLKSIRSYFEQGLEKQFSTSEIKFMFQIITEERLKLSPAEQLISADFRLSESDLLHYRSCVKRLLNDEPFQYIIGKTEFYDLEILCSPSALIPRPETEELVDWIVQTFPSPPKKALDLCTGTGCIALALKSKWKTTEIHAIDVSEKALDLAKKNATSLDLPVNFQKLDVLDTSTSNWSQLGEANSYDCWVSNPPYIPTKQKEEMHDNVLRFEPEIALFVEDHEPLIFYRIISEKALIYLKKGGYLFFELNEYYAEESKNLLEELGFREVEIKEDLQGKRRMLVGRK